MANKIAYGLEGKAAIDQPLDASVTQSVGAYRLEGMGIQLMRDIRGEHTAILGLPLLPLLAYLRDAGVLQG